MRAMTILALNLKGIKDMHRSLRREWIAAYSLSLVLLSSLCAQAAYAIDFIAPQIEHQRATDSVARGEDHLITANVTDDTSVQSVVLHYREAGTRNFNPIIMRSLDGSSHYEALIVGQNILASGLEYFFEATDSAGNTLEMYGSNGEPFAIAVAQPDVALGSNGQSSRFDAPNARASSSRDSHSVLPIKKKSNKKTWLWVGLGVLAAAVIAGAAGGGSDSSPGPAPSNDNTGDIDITTPVPVN